MNPATPKLTRREETLVAMLERYREALEGGSTDPTGGDHSSRAFQLPTTWTWCYRELERLLKLMRSQGKQQAVNYGAEGKSCSLLTARWHLVEWWIDAEPRSVPLIATVSLKGGGKGTVIRGHQLVYRRHPDARYDRALAGLGWLAANWTHRQEPELPREFLPHQSAGQPRGKGSPLAGAPFAASCLAVSPPRLTRGHPLAR